MTPLRPLNTNCRTANVHYTHTLLRQNVLYNTNTTPQPTRTLTPPNGSQAGAQRERDITTSAHLLRQVGHEKAPEPRRTLATRSNVSLSSAPPRDCQGVDLTPANPTSLETHTIHITPNLNAPPPPPPCTHRRTIHTCSDARPAPGRPPACAPRKPRLAPERPLRPRNNNHYSTSGTCVLGRLLR